MSIVYVYMLNSYLNYIFIYLLLNFINISLSFQVKLVLNRDPMSVASNKEEIIKELRNVTDGLLVIDDVRYHVSQTEGLRRDMTDMYIHIVDPDSLAITDPDHFVKAVDSNYDYLAHYYADAGIDKVNTFLTIFLMFLLI